MDMENSHEKTKHDVHIKPHIFSFYTCHRISKYGTITNTKSEVFSNMSNWIKKNTICLDPHYKAISFFCSQALGGCDPFNIKTRKRKPLQATKEVRICQGERILN